MKPDETYRKKKRMTFYDISKQRNQEDKKKLNSRPNVDTTLRDFIGTYDLEDCRTTDTTKYKVLMPATMESLDDAANQNMRDRMHMKFTFSNKEAWSCAIDILRLELQRRYH